MSRQTLIEKLIDRNVEVAYQKWGSGVQVNMMDLGKIMNAGRDAARAGESVDDAIITALAQYRQN